MSIKQGNYLKELRTSKGMSQDALAEEIGISRQSISKWEQGTSSPEIDNIKKLSDFFGVSADSIIHGESDEKRAVDEALRFFNANEETVKESIEKAESDNEFAMPAPPSAEYKKVEVDDIYDIKAQLDDKKEEPQVEEKKEEKPKKKKKGAHWIIPTFPIFMVIAYLLVGVIFGKTGWILGWTILLLIPLFYTTIAAVNKKKPVIFCYPCLVIMIYVLLGYTFDIWHPLWIIFLTIPIFYVIAAKTGKKEDKED